MKSAFCEITFEGYPINHLTHHALPGNSFGPSIILACYKAAEVWRVWHWFRAKTELRLRAASHSGTPDFLACPSLPYFAKPSICQHIQCLQNRSTSGLSSFRRDFHINEIGKHPSPFSHSRTWVGALPWKCNFFHVFQTWWGMTRDGGGLYL